MVMYVGERWWEPVKEILPHQELSTQGPVQSLLWQDAEKGHFFLNLKNDKQNINTKLQRAQVNQFIKKKKLGSQLKMGKRHTHKIYMQIAF